MAALASMRASKHMLIARVRVGPGGTSVTITFTAVARALRTKRPELLCASSHGWYSNAKSIAKSTSAVSACARMKSTSCAVGSGIVILFPPHGARPASQGVETNHGPAAPYGCRGGREISRVNPRRTWGATFCAHAPSDRSEEHTSELQSLRHL